MELEIVEPWPAFLSGRTPLYATPPESIAILVCLVNGFHVPAEVVDCLEALSAIWRAHHASMELVSAVATAVPWRTSS